MAELDAVFDHPRSQEKSGGGDHMAKHHKERKALHERHGKEMADMHKRHEDDHKKVDGADHRGRHEMHARHSAERRAVHNRQMDEHDQMANRQAMEMEGGAGMGGAPDASSGAPMAQGAAMAPGPQEAVSGGATPTTGA